MRAFLLTATVLIFAAQSNAAIKTEVIEYQYENTKLKGYLAYDDAKKGKRPGIMVVHEWWGLNDYAKKRAEQLAEMGYVAFAADLYGNGQVTEHPTDAGKMATEVRSNVKVWLGRAEAGLKILKDHAEVDSKKLAVIGYCFGGTTALQVALSGADVAACVSFHGALPKVTPDQAKAAKAKILVCHGANDNFIPKTSIESFRKTLDDAKASYQFESYPDAVHSFTVKDIEKKGIDGLAYNEAADAKSWKQMKELFDTVFGK
jgi:dienelactone hydrolase